MHAFTKPRAKIGTTGSKGHHRSPLKCGVSLSGVKNDELNTGESVDELRFSGFRYLSMQGLHEPWREVGS